MANKKEKGKPSIGDLRRKDEMVIKKMDPVNPNIYYGTENMLGPNDEVGNYGGFERTSLPWEDIWSDMDRIQRADSEEDIERRKRDIHSVWSPEELKRPELPFTKFSPALTENTNLQGFLRPKRNAVDVEKLIIPANAPPLTTRMTAKHELLHSDYSPKSTREHESSSKPHIMSAPAQKRIERTSKVLQKLIEKGIPEEEAAAEIVKDLSPSEKPMSTVDTVLWFLGYDKNSGDSNWDEYEKNAPERIIKRRKKD